MTQAIAILVSCLVGTRVIRVRFSVEGDDSGITSSSEMGSSGGGSPETTVAVVLELVVGDTALVFFLNHGCGFRNVAGRKKS